MERRTFLGLLSGSITALLVAPPRSALAAEERPLPIVPIVAPALGVRNISMAMLRRVFRGEVTEANGKRLMPFNYAPENPVRRAFDLEMLGLSPDEVGRYWIDRRIRGQGLPPKTLPSQILVRAVVARLNGAIGYVTTDHLNDAVQPLTIDGKHHTDSSYPLRMR